MANPNPPLNPLDALQASFNAALLEVAYTMKNHARPDLNHIACSNANPQNLPGPKYTNPALTLHLDRFHVSLDELERELFRAQAVMRRDVAVHRVAREAREAEEARVAAEEAQKQKMALKEKEEQEKKAAAAAQSKAAAAAAAASAPAATHSSANQDQDVTMTGTDAFTALPSTAAHTAANPRMLPNQHIPKPLAVETNATSNAQTSGAPETAETTTDNDDLFGRSPTTAGLNNNDLDSMFEDLTNDQDNGGGDSGGNDVFGDSQQGEIDFALLPGLESYANIDSGGDKQQGESGKADDAGAKKQDESSGDMFDFCLGSTDESQSQNQGQQQQQQNMTNQGQAQQNNAANQEQKKDDNQQQQPQDVDAFNPDAYAGDSSFDDMFNYADFDLGGDTGGGDGTGDTAFDDDFFNI
ncbi:hypothetical protein HDK77DRAFT_264751 [Phyllosticta capitalensis]